MIMNREYFKFEVCANSVASCIAAEQAGADRVELCAGIPEGGTTPSLGAIAVARDVLKNTKLHVIIRPRGGDFLYSEEELEQMFHDINVCRKWGVDGVVFGCLTSEGRVHMLDNRDLMDEAKGMSVTFHRAFDRTVDPFKALEDIIGLGFDRILTSGQQPKAIDGVNLLEQLHDKAKGRIHLLAGSGVNEDNIREIYEHTGIHEYHFSARVGIKSGMKNMGGHVYMGAKGADEQTILVTSKERVEQTIANLLKE